MPTVEEGLDWGCNAHFEGMNSLLLMFDVLETIEEVLETVEEF